MTESLLIVGAGPAAAGAALAASRDPRLRITVLDVGGGLEEAHDAARSRLAASPPQDWDSEDLATITQLPIASDLKGLPEKRAFGSDFPFRDFGQREAISSETVNAAAVSGAYGGFSNAWGAQFMPFTDASFSDWPLSADELRPHYTRILEQVPFAAADDDLAEMFPLLADPAPLPELSDRSRVTLRRYERKRDRLRSAGLVMGAARLAFDSDSCVRCGLCMTGCPYSLIYSAAQTLTELRSRSAIDYRSGLLAFEVREDEGSATVLARDTLTNTVETFVADRVLLAAGAIGSSRIVMNSLGLYDTPTTVQESSQFRLPFLSLRPVADPRLRDDFTLNQFNLAVTHDSDGRDVSQLHFYTYNPAFDEALPAVLRTRQAKLVRRELLKRLSVALGYLPSWASPTFTLEIGPPGAAGELPPMKLDSAASRPPALRMTMLRELASRLSRAAPALDLWPVLPALQMSAGGKSYHWGSVFPHSKSSTSRFCSDRLGRVAPWRRIHLVDSSTFPTVPATTFGLTVMANAHRIVATVLEGGDDL